MPSAYRDCRAVLADCLTSRDELPALPGVPLEADRLETLGGLLDKQLVFADGTEARKANGSKYVPRCKSGGASRSTTDRSFNAASVEASRRRRQGVRVRDAREVT